MRSAVTATTRPVWSAAEAQWRYSTERIEPPRGVISSSSDAATRALSVTAVENDFVEGVYDKLAAVYDWTFGPTLHPGRLQAIQRMGIQPDATKSSRSASAPASTWRSIRASAR